MRISRFLYLFGKIALEILAYSAGSYLAFFLRFDGRNFDYISVWRHYLPVILAARIGSMYVLTGYRMDWRAAGLTDYLRILCGVTLGTAILFVVTPPINGAPYPRWVLLDWFIISNLCVGQRVFARHLVGIVRSAQTRMERKGRHRRRVLIVGAGHAGAWIARALKEDPHSEMRVVGFVDDDVTKHSMVMHGIRVLGPIEDLPALVEKQRAEQVLIAIPSLTASRLREIVHIVEESPARLSIVPGLPQIVNGRTATNLIRDVSVEDLLERSPVRANLESIAAYLAGQRVLITGAGGSIGSELCRQIAGFNPEALILLGQGENSIFWIEQELRTEFGTEPIGVIADIKDRVKLEKVFRDHKPTVVFHAAAHKHVPLMERNPEEAIKNNVFGTRNLAELSIEYGVKKFVMISTDKAVNPTSVMGASKRVAEMVVQSLAQRIEALRSGNEAGVHRHLNSLHAENPVTAFAAVRFGNVLGSRGSVIPTMRKQIAKGGPVTVTHPEMVRFFMTIPEAVELVIQAGAMSENGETFVLDMGKPVKIMDLARNLIRLSGFTPEKDIPIKITGIRPGEKLYEEVLTAEEGTSVTSHEKIFVARPTLINHEHLHDNLDRLELLAQRGDPNAIRKALQETVPTYTPKIIGRPDAATAGEKVEDRRQ